MTIQKNNSNNKKKLNEGGKGDTYHWIWIWN